MLRRPIAIAVAGLMLVPAGAAGEEHPPRATAFSISGAPAPVGFTLLDPAWLLPPIESLDLLPPPAEEPETGPHQLPSGLLPGQAPTAPVRPTSAKVGYSISDDLTAQLRYHRSKIFGSSNSQTLRDDQWSSFSTQPFRDVFDLNMSWQLAGSTVGIGYQFQSARSSTSTEDGFTRFLPTSPQTTHSLTLGLTRQWGAGAEAPRLVDSPVLLSPDLDAAAEAGTPTPPQ